MLFKVLGVKVESSKPYYLILDASGNLVETGSGEFYILQDGETAQEFDTEKDCCLHPVVAKNELNDAVLIMQAEVEQLKSDHAYSAKEADARAILSMVVDGSLPDGCWDASKYPHIALEVNSKGCTPVEASQSVIQAVSRSDEHDIGTLARECKRLELKEKIARIKDSISHE